MDVYPLLKPILFKLEPERAHTLTLKGLQFAYQLGLLNSSRIENPKTVMGLTFKNPIGLAAGLDKNGDYIEALAALGFGFIEIGTITPKPQLGNQPPRLFRLVDDLAIINRLGFNNKGAMYVAHRLAQTRYQGILGINIGKNRDTPNEYAFDDYVMCFRKLAPFASYITINISSPNTPNLRELQQGEALSNLLKKLKNEQATYLKYSQKYVPLVIKISPDVTNEELQTIATSCLAEKIDGVIATNTTLAREDLRNKTLAHETGGLSGKPLFSKSTAVVQKLQQLLDGKIPIIAVGGIMDAANARAKFAAGASLLQIYSGLIYRGPRLIKELMNL